MPIILCHSVTYNVASYHNITTPSNDFPPFIALCMLTCDFLVNFLNLGGRGPGTEPAGEEGRAGEEREAGVRDVLLLHTFQNFELTGTPSTSFSES